MTEEPEIIKQSGITPKQRKQWEKKQKKQREKDFWLRASKGRWSSQKKWKKMEPDTFEEHWGGRTP